MCLDMQTVHGCAFICEENNDEDADGGGNKKIVSMKRSDEFWRARALAHINTFAFTLKKTFWFYYVLYLFYWPTHVVNATDQHTHTH